MGEIDWFERPRIRKLRSDLIGTVPRFPNDRGALLHVERKHLVDLLIDYINWRSRYVGVGPRKIIIETTASSSPEWSSNSAAVRQFLEAVERGDDLTPYLSLQPHTRGYSPDAHRQGATPEQRWSDKDFVLNTRGYHHFHIGTITEAKGHVKRTDEVVFARVSRSEFTVIAILNHDVFKVGSFESKRLLAIHDEIMHRNTERGTVYIDAMITTSGHALHVIQYALKCAQKLRDTEERLDDGPFLRSIYEENNVPSPPKHKLRWEFIHLDLFLVDQAGPAHFRVLKGWS